MGKIIQFCLFLRSKIYPNRQDLNKEQLDLTTCLIHSKNTKNSTINEKRINFSNPIHFYWRLFDDKYLKPLFIYNYNKRKGNENWSIHQNTYTKHDNFSFANKLNEKDSEVLIQHIDSINKDSLINNYNLNKEIEEEEIEEEELEEEELVEEEKLEEDETRSEINKKMKINLE